MRLSARPVVAYNSPNSFTLGSQWIVRAGDANTLYFQVVDLDQGPQNVIAGLPYQNIPLASNQGLRYLVGLTATTSSIDVTFPSINPQLSITLSATLVNPADKSLWSVAIPSAAQPGGGNVQFAVMEDASRRSFSATNILAVEYSNSSGSC